MIGEKAVDEATPESFFEGRSRNFDQLRLCIELRGCLRLIPPRDRARMRASLTPSDRSRRVLVANAVHRFEESIAGRSYVIEVASVSADRWRACIVRLPGVPTALMPFYGRTPDEAARHLTDWLTRAHQRAGTAVS